MVEISNFNNFEYTPPHSAIEGSRILIKPNLGYPEGPPVTVSLQVLKSVISGVKKHNPKAQIIIVEGVCSPCTLQEIVKKTGVVSLLEQSHVSLLDADELALKKYKNTSPSPIEFEYLWAPKVLEEVDCRITIGALKRTESTAPLISASLKNLYGLFPRSKYSAEKAHARGVLHKPSVDQVLQDIYFCVGWMFDGAVVDAGQRFVSFDWRPDKGRAYDLGKVFWGEDTIAVDRKACEYINESIPLYIKEIENQKNSSKGLKQ